MAAAEGAGDVPERAIAAFDAGCDMVLVCRGLESAAAAADRIADWRPAPQSAARLARLRPRGACPNRDELHSLTAWREAAAVAAELEKEERCKDES